MSENSGTHHLYWNPAAESFDGSASEAALKAYGVKGMMSSPPMGDAFQDIDSGSSLI
jgi:hypothetical protein